MQLQHNIAFTIQVQVIRKSSDIKFEASVVECYYHALYNQI